MQSFVGLVEGNLVLWIWNECTGSRMHISAIEIDWLSEYHTTNNTISFDNNDSIMMWHASGMTVVRIIKKDSNFVNTKKGRRDWESEKNKHTWNTHNSRQHNSFPVLFDGKWRCWWELERERVSMSTEKANNKLGGRKKEKSRHAKV